MKKIKLSIKFLFFGLAISCANETENCADCELETSDSTVTTEIVEKATYTYDVDSAAFIDKLAETNGNLIDVRTPEEYANGFIEGAVNINFNGPDFESEIEKLDKSKPAFVYCMAGGRSSKAMQKMHEMGFEEVYNLLGGYSGYIGSGESH